MHTCVSVHVYVYAERDRISVTLVTTAAQGCASDLYMCVCARANLSTVVHRRLGVAVAIEPPLASYICPHRDTKTHTHSSNTKNTDKYMSSNDRKSTLPLKHSISVLSHEKHAHSLNRKPGKNAGWQDRQLVAIQKKVPVSRRNRELDHQL
jgi:hypothetical protein